MDRLSVPFRRSAEQVVDCWQAWQSDTELEYRLCLLSPPRGIKNFARRTTNAILFFLVDEPALHMLAVTNLAAPQRKVGCYSVFLERANNRRRTVASIGNRFGNIDVVLFSEPLELRQVRLVVMPCTGGDFRIENHTAISVNTLVNLVFKLSRRSSLLGQCRLWIGATASAFGW